MFRAMGGIPDFLRLPTMKGLSDFATVFASFPSCLVAVAAACHHRLCGSIPERCVSASGQMVQ